ncbi:MAG: DUF3786 domain-containing protein [Chloroflexi bacterium]|nr:DUF3786 domain-containing protein [Chloroflexota bacterium]MBU1747112.1 DUF3786 domain-containing protein [Chloroflexota bacterium]
MSPEPRSPAETYGPALESAQREFRALDPAITAWKADVAYENGVFRVPFFGGTYLVAWPTGEVYQVVPDGGRRDASITTRLIILHYLIHADGTPVQGDWIAFRELPDGMVYFSAFQNRGPTALLWVVGRDAAGFRRAAQKLHGDPLSFGDASYAFWVFPRLPVAVVLYEGDDEFSPSLNVLFDRAAGHYLPTEDLAGVGGMLTGRLRHAIGQTDT